LNKKKIIKALLQESMKSEDYDITMLATKRFIIELDDNDFNNFIYFLENKLKYDRSKYEFKLEIV